MQTLKLAWRSFLRHRRRSAITAAAISLSLAMMIFFKGISEDSHMRMADMGVRLGSGHVLVQGKGYQERQTLDLLVPEPAKVLTEAKRLPGVQAVVPRVIGGGLITAGGQSAAVGVGGVDPALEPKVSEIASKERRVRGEYLRTRAQLEFENAPADIYLGDELAKNLEVEVGDRLVLTVSPLGSSRPASAAFRVRGTFRTGLTELDSAFAQIPIAEAQKLLALGGGVTQVAVLLDSLDAARAASQQLETALGDAQRLEVLSWQVALRELYEALVLDDASFVVMMWIIYIIVGIGIFNTVMMSVAERTREFGVMMAIGTSKKRLFALILTEGAVLAIVSVVVGVALGLAGHFYIASTGIDIAAMAGGDYQVAGIAFNGKIYSQLSPKAVFDQVIVVVGIVLAAAAYPALRATWLKPVEAMRHV